MLFDNLDKGWPASGLGPDDLVLIRSLLDAVNNLRRALAKKEIECNGIIFIRNDVFELLVAHTPDRGKVGHVAVDWTDPNELREILRRRFVFSGAQQAATFDQVWQQICITHYRGEESSQYFIDRCLMRPRGLIDLIGFCRSHAINLGKHRIDEQDVAHGEENYSTDLIHNIGYELRDVFPAAGDALYELLGAPKRLGKPELWARIRGLSLTGPQCDELFRLLLWYAVLGVVRDNDEVAYIYNVSYDMKRLLGLISRTPDERQRFEINPAFWAALEVTA